MSNYQEGKYTYNIGYKVYDHHHRGNKVIIGNFCSISHNCIYLLDHNHATDTVSTFPFWGPSAGILKSDTHVTAKNKGEVVSVAGAEITVQEEDGFRRIYSLRKYNRSNQSTCIDQRAVVFKGDRVEVGTAR